MPKPINVRFNNTVLRAVMFSSIVPTIVGTILPFKYEVSMLAENREKNCQVGETPCVIRQPRVVIPTCCLFMKNLSWKKIVLATD